jgi:hypothetical protein
MPTNSMTPQPKEAGEMKACPFCSATDALRQEPTGPDGLPTNHPDSRFWWRHDGTFQPFPAGHTRRSWEEGPAAESYARAAHLPED